MLVFEIIKKVGVGDLSGVSDKIIVEEKLKELRG